MESEELGASPEGEWGAEQKSEASFRAGTAEPGGHDNISRARKGEKAV